MHVYTHSRSQTKDRGHWSGSKTSAQVKSWANVQMADTVFSWSSGQDLWTPCRCIQLPTYSYTKNSLFTVLVNCKVRMVSFQYSFLYCSWSVVMWLKISVSSHGNCIAKWEATKLYSVSRPPFGAIGPKGLIKRGALYLYFDFIEASLSEPHTSVTSLRTCVCMFAWTDHLPQILNERIHIFHDDRHIEACAYEGQCPSGSLTARVQRQ